MLKGLDPSSPLNSIFSQCLPGRWVWFSGRRWILLYIPTGSLEASDVLFFNMNSSLKSKHCEKSGCQSFTLTRHYESQQTASQMWPLPALLEADGAGSDVLREGSKGFFTLIKKRCLTDSGNIWGRFLVWRECPRLRNGVESVVAGNRN